MAENKYEMLMDGQSNYGWSKSLDMTNKVPAIAKRIFNTYSEILAYCNDLNSSAIPGLVLAALSDDESGKDAGLYYVSSVNKGNNETSLVYLGGNGASLLEAVEKLDGEISSRESGEAALTQKITALETLMKSLTVERKTKETDPSLSDDIEAQYTISLNGETLGGEPITIYKERFIKEIKLTEKFTFNKSGVCTDGRWDAKTGTITSENPTNPQFMTISFQTTEGYRIVQIDLSQFLTQDEFSDGLKVEEGVVSVKINPNSKNYLTADENGLQLNLAGITNTVDSKVNKVLGSGAIYIDESQPVTPAVNLKISEGDKYLSQSESGLSFNALVQTSLSGSTQMLGKVGGLEGLTAEQLSKMTVSEVLQKMLFKEYGVKATLPYSSNLSLEVTPSTTAKMGGVSIYEVGTPVTVKLVSTYNDGYYTGVDEYSSYRLNAGCEQMSTSCTKKAYNASTNAAISSPNDLSDTFTITQPGTVTYTTKYSYKSGSAVPVTNFGNACNDIIIKAGSTTEKSASFKTGVKWFIGYAKGVKNNTDGSIKCGGYKWVNDHISYVDAEGSVMPIDKDFLTIIRRNQSQEAVNASTSDTVKVYSFPYNGFLADTGETTAIGDTSISTNFGVDYTHSIIIACPEGYSLTAIDNDMGMSLLDNFRKNEVVNVVYNGTQNTDEVKMNYRFYMYTVSTDTTMKIKNVRISKV